MLPTNLLKYFVNIFTSLYSYFRRLGKLDPLLVNDSQAKKFFDIWKSDNTKLLNSVQKHIKRSNTIFDVGTNSGFFSKGILESGYKGRLVLFEPIPNLISIAVRTLSEFTNEKIFVNAALGESADVIDIFLPKNSNIGWITLVKEKADSKRCVKVLVDDTKKYVDYFKPDFVKIDIEGYELFVLRPFLEFISDSYKPTFLVELGWGVTNPNWASFIKVAEEFKSKGYKFVKVSGEPANMDISDLAELNHTIDVLIEPIE
jgi:FkbM family methyltransferase